MSINPFLKDFLDELEREQKKKSGFGGLGKPNTVPVQDDTETLQDLNEFRLDTEIPLIDFEPRDQNEKNILWDVVGSTLWGAADEAGFGAPGMADALLDLDLAQTPESGLAQFGAAVGRLTGFAAGAPMKFGLAVTRKVAQPFLKKAVAEIGETSAEKFVIGKTDDIAKKAVKDINEKLGQQSKDILKGFDRKIVDDFADSYRVLSNKTTFNKELADNFLAKSGSSIDNLLTEYVRGGKITQQQMELLRQIGRASCRERV